VSRDRRKTQRGEWRQRADSDCFRRGADEILSEGKVTATKDKTPTPAADEAQADLEIEARQATEAVTEARRKCEADAAALARLEAEADFPPSATDAQISEHLLSTEVARVRARQSKRALDAAEEAAKTIVERAAREAAKAERRRTLEAQREAVDRFYREYDGLVGGLYALFLAAHAAEMAAGDASKGAEEGEERYASAFQFSSRGPIANVRIKVIDRGGSAMWEGDLKSDVASLPPE
jgi:hypothetical protein